MQPRPVHRVSCKAAIYSTDGTKVLLMRYPQLGEGAHGLPGGHLEEGENPDAAVLREIAEELGFDNLNIPLARTDFWPHENGKIILGYVGAADFTVPPAPDPGFEFAVWAPVAELCQRQNKRRFIYRFCCAQST